MRCSAVSSSAPPHPALKTFTTFSYSPHLSLTSPHCETWQPEPPPHHSSPLLSPRWKLFFADKPLWVLSLSAGAQARVAAAFSSSVCCIFWFIYTSLIVAPRACQESQSRTLACALCGAESNSYLKYTWMHEYIYRREAPVHPGESHFLRWPCSGMEWRDPWRRPTCDHQIEPPGAPLTQLNGGREGKWFGSYLRGWSSRFKAVCLAEALTGLLSALDVRPVMSLWRVRAVLAGRLRLHCTGVGVRGLQRDLQVGGFNRIVVLHSALLRQAGLKRVDPKAAMWRGSGCCVTFRHTYTLIHTYIYIYPSGRCCGCVCVCVCVSCGWLEQMKVWVCITDGGNNDQIALVMETAQFVMAS